MSQTECLREIVTLLRDSALRTPHSALLNRQQAIAWLGYTPSDRESVPGLKRLSNKTWLFHVGTFVKSLEKTAGLGGQ